MADDADQRPSPVLARADRRQVWKPLQPAAAAVLVGVAVGLWVGDPRAWLGGGLLIATMGGLAVGRAVLWSWLGDLSAEPDGLTYRPRRGEVWVLPWSAMRYVSLHQGAPVLPQWHLAKHHGPLPELRIHLRADLHHPWAPGCAQAPSTPGLSGLGAHGEREQVDWELALLVRPASLPDVETRLARALGSRGIRFDGPTRQSGVVRLPWEQDLDEGSGR